MPKNRTRSLASRYTIVNGARFRLSQIDPGSTRGVTNKAAGVEPSH